MVSSMSVEKRSAGYLLSGVVVIVVWCLPILVPVAFVLGSLVADVLALLGVDVTVAPNIWFLRDQYEFISKHGVSAQLNVYNLQIFGLFVWGAALLLLLRLLTAPLLLGVSSPHRRRTVPDMSLGRLAVGLIVLGLFAMWAAIDIRGSTMASQLDFFLRHSPNAYIGLEAFVFVGGALFFVEGVVTFFQMIWLYKMTSASTFTGTRGEG